MTERMSPTRIRRTLTRHPLLVDVVLAGATAIVSLGLGHQPPPEPGMRDFDVTGYGATILMSLLLVARRRAPVPVLALYCALWIGYETGGYAPVVNSAGAMLALYTVAAHRPPRVAVLGAAGVAGAWIYGGFVVDTDAPLTVAAQGIIWSSVVCWLGGNARELAERGQRLAVLAHRLQREQEYRAQRAVTEERLRIARELHDVVAHHMSVASVQAGLARYVLDSDPATTRTALGVVVETIGEALNEMRRMLSLLRTDSDDATTGTGAIRSVTSGTGAAGTADGTAGEGYDPAPGLDRLTELIDRVRVTGVPVDLVFSGPRRPLGSGADLCVYRVVQESLTNVLKHAGPVPTTVTVRFEEDRLLVSVVNEEQPVAGGTARRGARADEGHGLVGMRERALLYGGTLTAGPCPEGGFAVHLTLPVPATDGEHTAPPPA